MLKMPIGGLAFRRGIKLYLDLKSTNEASKSCKARHNNSDTPTSFPSQTFDTMAPGQKMYPRATVKKIVKAHSKCNVSKNVDVMVRLNLYECLRRACPDASNKRLCLQIFLDYVLFMQTLIKEATIDAKQAGERNISAKSIRKSTPDTLAKFKG
ncbi:hypothetical protein F4782DRAFT_96248 [Xylaria castorea]|nr:hypothetical protein F4782DRAFT_96248 [Xylaria castorea]